MLASNSPIHIDRMGILTGATAAWVMVSAAAVTLLLLTAFCVPRFRRQCGRPVLVVLLIVFAGVMIRSAFHLDAILLETSMGRGVVEAYSGVICLGIDREPTGMEEPPILGWCAIDRDSPDWDLFEFGFTRGDDIVGLLEYGLRVSITPIAAAAGGVWWFVTARRNRRVKLRGFDLREPPGVNR